MSAFTARLTASRKTTTFRQPPCEDLVRSSHRISQRTSMDPLDKVRAQGERYKKAGWDAYLARIAQK